MKIKPYYEPTNRSIIDDKALSELEKLKVKCVCGHTKIMPVYLDTTICNFCKRKIYNNTKMYFMYKVRKARKEIENNEDKN